MKIECVLEKLQESIQYVAITASKSVITPLLQQVYLEAKDHTLILRSTSIDISSEVRIPVKVHTEGMCLIHVDIFTRLFQSLTTEEKNIILECVDSTLMVTHGKNVHQLKISPQEDFPQIPNITDNSETTSFPVSVLIEAISTVSFASAQTDLKPEIASVYLYTEEGLLISVATDSFRLAEKKIKVKNTAPLSLLVPIKQVGDVLKLLKLMQGNVTLVFNKNTLLIQGNGALVHVRLIDGMFPKYQQIIPSSYNTTITFLKQDLIHMLRTMFLFTDRFYQMNIEMLPGENTVLLSTENGDVGSSKQYLVTKNEGEPVTLRVNGKYVQDTLPQFFKESISIQCVNPQKPLVLKSVHDESYTYLIMPLSR
jgi:DNA polymerase III subunit beta